MASTSIHIRDYRTEIPGGLSADRLTWEFPIVWSINANGKKTFWQIYVRYLEQGEFTEIQDSYFNSAHLPDIAWINVDSGVVGGKVKKSVPTLVKFGKNVGRASATNTWTQALRDAYSLYNKQKKKSALGAVLYPPMLAQILKDQSKPPIVDAEHVVYVQRKYNGVRTVGTQVDKKVVLYSRRRNIYPGFTELCAELEPVLQSYWDAGRQLYLDGELYKHGAALQDISGAARREGSFDANYMIYDCFIVNEPQLKYSERRVILNDIFSKFDLKISVNVETFTAQSYAEINALYEVFLEEEYEGAMVRLDDVYQYSYNERHVKSLLKIKPSYDDEMEIVGFSTGEKGKAANALMIVCKTAIGTIPVTPAMEIVDRIALAKKMAEVEPNGKTHFVNHWLGKKIIVTYSEKSKDGVPQQARTKMEIRSWD